MGVYTHLHVCFACDTNDGVAALARTHLARLNERPLGEWEDYDTRDQEAQWFLEALSDRTGPNPGPKGGLSIWGITGKNTSGQQFVDMLTPFWSELLISRIEGGPLPFEHILVFEETEDSGHATAYEILLEDEHNASSLVARRHICPFAWGQM